ncbi:MAG TPA: MarR family transcriptional regulator [Solirubrobacteraceae bacterium]
MATTTTHGTLTLISRLSKVSIRRSSEEMLGMSLRNYLAVSYIAEPGAISQQQLGEILCIDANNLVLLLNDLEQAGLTRRVRDPADRRRHIVEITEHGRVAYEHAQRARESLEDEVLAALSGEERATLHRLLAKALQE